MMKSLLGKNFSDPEVQEEMKKLPFKIVQMEDDHIGIEVNYDGENRVFTPEHITAILLNHCCELAQKANKSSGKADVVISVQISFVVLYLGTSFLERCSASCYVSCFSNCWCEMFAFD